MSNPTDKQIKHAAIAYNPIKIGQFEVRFYPQQIYPCITTIDTKWFNDSLPTVWHDSKQAVIARLAELSLYPVR
jgi:hypothetical protein